MGIKDDVGVQDVILAELTANRGPATYPCPKCGKATKEHVPAGMRICSMDNCRTETAQSDIEPIYLAVASPRFPCPKCGKETKEHVPAGTRICCMDNCRTVVSAPSV